MVRTGSLARNAVGVSKLASSGDTNDSDVAWHGLIESGVGSSSCGHMQRSGSGQQHARTTADHRSCPTGSASATQAVTSTVRIRVICCVVAN